MTAAGGVSRAAATHAVQQRAVTCGEERRRLMALETRTRLPSAAHDEGGTKGFMVVFRGGFGGVERGLHVDARVCE